MTILVQRFLDLPEKDHLSFLRAVGCTVLHDTTVNTPREQRCAGIGQVWCGTETSDWTNKQNVWNTLVGDSPLDQDLILSVSQTCLINNAERCFEYLWSAVVPKMEDFQPATVVRRLFKELSNYPILPVNPQSFFPILLDAVDNPHQLTLLFANFLPTPSIDFNVKHPVSAKPLSAVQRDIVEHILQRIERLRVNTSVCIDAEFYEYTIKFLSLVYSEPEMVRRFLGGRSLEEFMLTLPKTFTSDAESQKEWQHFLLEGVLPDLNVFPLPPLYKPHEQDSWLARMDYALEVYQKLGITVDLGAFKGIGVMSSRGNDGAVARLHQHQVLTQTTSGYGTDKRVSKI